jgi:hypothetical protein
VSSVHGYGQYNVRKYLTQYRSLLWAEVPVNYSIYDRQQRQATNEITINTPTSLFHGISSIYSAKEEVAEGTANGS